jgi:LytS/YehU family sensor histidine kinase
MDFLDDYVAIQRVRFADRLCVEKSIAADALDGLVPTMILQPIVENAIEHGVNGQRGVGHVNVSAIRENGSRPKCAIAAPASSGRRTSRHRLANTRARLSAAWGRLSPKSMAASRKAEHRPVSPFRFISDRCDQHGVAD